MNNELILYLLVASLPFGELGTVVPKSGSIYIYLQTAFRSLHPFYGELPAFIYLWVTYVIVEPCNNAVCAFLLADYVYVILQAFFSGTLLTDNEAALKCIIGVVTLGKCLKIITNTVNFNALFMNILFI